MADHGDIAEQPDTRAVVADLERHELVVAVRQVDGPHHTDRLGVDGMTIDEPKSGRVDVLESCMFSTSVVLDQPPGRTSGAGAPRRPAGCREPPTWGSENMSSRDRSRDNGDVTP